MLLKRRRFTWVELVVVIGVLLVLVIAVALPILSIKREKARRVNCAGNLKSIGLSLLMYAGDFDGCFPNVYPNGGNSFEPLTQQNYIGNGKIWACPSRGDVLTLAANSAYVYVGSGLVDSHPKAKTTTLAHDRPGNHRKCSNVLFISGHVEGNGVRIEKGQPPR